jgi:hypothetical protein
MPAGFIPPNAFKPGNQMAKLGGIAKRENGFKQQAAKWVREHGYDKAVAWVDGKDGDKEVPWPSRQYAMGILFGYALGRPAEQIQIEDKRELFITLAQDPKLNELARNFGDAAHRIREIQDSVVVDGQPEIPPQETPT